LDFKGGVHFQNVIIPYSKGNKRWKEVSDYCIIHVLYLRSSYNNLIFGKCLENPEYRVDHNPCCTAYIDLILVNIIIPLFSYDTVV
jgi:hypothetical protein